MSLLLVIMGVAGSGKSTIGRRLATELGWPYHEADDFHNEANKAKMARGIPLEDTDRLPWLTSIRTAMESQIAAGQSAVFTCSALKESYRHILCDDLPETRLIYLSGSRDLLLTRIQGRSGHYMKPGMLESQLAALEPPAGALALDISESPEKLVAHIRRQCGV